MTFSVLLYYLHLTPQVLVGTYKKDCNFKYEKCAQEHQAEGVKLLSQGMLSVVKRHFLKLLIWQKNKCVFTVTC